MTRVLRIGARFRTAADRLGAMPGTDRGRAVGRAIRARLDAEALPLPADVVALVPPTGRAYVGRVQGRNLWIWYQLAEDAILVLYLTSEPPVPVS